MTTIARPQMLRILAPLTAAWLALSALDAHGAGQDDIVAALRAGDPRQAYTLARDAAAGGDAWAMDYLGTLYLNGSAPVARDPAQAYEWLRKAADLGDGDAMSRLGEIHFHGLGRPRDLHAALDWYRRGAEHGSAAAMNNLAVCLLEGTGTARDPKAAIALLETAAERDPAAQENLAGLYRQGLELPRDDARARALYERAAGTGSGNAMLALAQLHADDTSTQADPSLACRWAILASTRGRREAQTLIDRICRGALDRPAFVREAEAAKRWVDEHPGAYGPLSRP